MSVQIVNVLVPPLRVVPPGAAWIADAVAWLFAGSEGLRNRLAAERGARRLGRARRDLLALAMRYEASQPSFAKDLFAAAGNDRRR